MSAAGAAPTDAPSAGVLVLGGTAEARALATRLDALGIPVLSSLAGRVARPRLPVGDVRIGGFGGVAGLSEHLRSTRPRVVVDATHPFAAQISGHAALACAEVGVPLLRLQRPGWSCLAGASSWSWVDTHEEAAQVTVPLGRRPFLTVGRQSLEAFAGPLASHDALVRVVDEPSVGLPAAWRLLRDRGPYSLEGELAVMGSHGADVLVTKDSGGSHTRPKLEAAARLGVPVVVVRRPPAPAGVATVAEVEAAVEWVVRVVGAPSGGASARSSAGSSGGWSGAVPPWAPGAGPARSTVGEREVS